MSSDVFDDEELILEERRFLFGSSICDVYTPKVQNDILSLQLLKSALCGIREAVSFKTDSPCTYRVLDPRIIQDR
jgi:hypothetical protein